MIVLGIMSLSLSNHKQFRLSSVGLSGCRQRRLRQLVGELQHPTVVYITADADADSARTSLIRLLVA
eukprot:COSAG06_NODE_2733_length_6369_cov_4.490878_3_plen_67_part_00